MTGIRVNGATSGTGVIGAYAYDNLGRRASVSRGNGVSSAYGYDGVSRLTSLSHNLSGPTQDVTWNYGYNPAGQIVSQTRNNDLYAWTGGTNGTTTYQPDGLNRIDLLNGADLPYDVDGNLLNDGTRAFTYDAANRLTAAAAVTMTYDPLSRLERSQGANDLRYVYDGAAIVGLASGGTSVTQRFIPGPWTDEVAGNVAASGNINIWLHDHQSSSVAIVPSTGVAAAINRYDEYGVPDPANAGALQYTGQLWLSDTGVYYYKNRWYHPGLGRFLQTDPIGYQAGMNLYGYVGGDPVNWTDPLGLCAGLESYDYPNFNVICTGELPLTRNGGGGTYGGGVAALISGGGGGGGAAGGGGGGIGGFFPGAGVNRGDVRNTPEYRRYEPYRDAALEDNAIYAEPVLALIPGIGLPSRLLGRAGQFGLRRLCQCFEASTEVWTEEGLKSIEDIQVGDRVLSRDDTSGQTAYRPVVELIRNQDRPIWEVTVELDDGSTEVIATTDEHPWRTTDGRWVETDNLSLGFELVTAEGLPVEVISVVATNRVSDTYNFEVEGSHTYFVGETGVWVHNACRPYDFPRSVKALIRQLTPNCANCTVRTVSGVRDVRGVTPSPNRSEIHHRVPGVGRGVSDGINLCRTCHRLEHP